MNLMNIKNGVDYKETFEDLRLQFTALFLQNPAMLKENSYAYIIKEAAKFTEMYIDYEHTSLNEEPMYRESIDQKIMNAMREHKDLELQVYRAVKAAFTNHETAKNAVPLNNATEISIIKKMKTEREEDAKIYIENDRKDLAERELAEAKILGDMLPQGPTKVELEKELAAYSHKMGWFVQDADGQATVVIPKKSMGLAIKHLKNVFPSADGKEISDLVKGWLPNG